MITNGNLYSTKQKMGMKGRLHQRNFQKTVRRSNKVQYQADTVETIKRNAFLKKSILE